MIRRLKGRLTRLKVSISRVIHRHIAGLRNDRRVTLLSSSECRVSAKEQPMRLVKFSIAAVCLSTLVLGVVVANAVLAPMPAKIGAWTTTVTVN
jgi:hypothetical protein